MREDMYKVIVERPRRGGNYRGENPAPLDLDNSPKQEGLKRRHRDRKWLNENLRPLERYLAAQVGRPWDKVYSEICASVDRRHTVQQHIHQHLADFVERETHLIDGKVMVMRYRIGMQPIEDHAWLKYYVHPRTGLLCINKRGMAKHMLLKRKRADDRLLSLYPMPYPRVHLDPSTQLHCVDGIWYHIELAPITGNESKMDVLRRLPAGKCAVLSPSGRIPDNHTLFWRHDVFAIRKRQLSALELKQHGLSNASTPYCETPP